MTASPRSRPSRRYAPPRSRPASDPIAPIPSMNWYHREEARYVEYGSSFSASRQFGVLRSLTDTVYRMNAEHLNPEIPTVFESLDDIDVRTAGTTYLIYRGRYPHEVANETALARIVTSTLFRRTIHGPRELFYADIYASRKTGCRGQLGMPGIRDQHTGCVGAFLEENDLYDFMLFSLPDNDAWSHKHGPHSQVTSVAAADRQIERLMHAGGGPERSSVPCRGRVSDHSQAPVEDRIRLARRSPSSRSRRRARRDPRARRSRCRRRSGRRWSTRSISTAASSSCSARSRSRWRPGGRPRVWLARRFGGRDPRTRRRGAAVRARRSGRGPARRALAHRRHAGGGWRRGARRPPAHADYPDALSRVWSALKCPTAGDVLLSAAPNYEFVDWGGADHVGGGSHGSLHSTDSLGC